MKEFLTNSAVFGWKNLPDELVFNGMKMIPLKKYKLRHVDAKNGGGVSVSNLRNVCRILNIEVFRPIMGLYCIRVEDCKFLDYLGAGKLYYSRREELLNEYHEFKMQNVIG